MTRTPDERIIVTGCSGYVGRNTVKMLLAEGHEVVGFCRTNPNIEGLQFIPFDITDSKNFQTTEYRHATIINTAALTTNDNHGNFAQTNYQSVLQLLGLNPQGKFIQISSSSIYDLGKPSLSITEDHFDMNKYNFYNPYSEYKAKAEHAILTGRVERDIQPVTLRPHAIYGADDTTLMPALLKRVRFGGIVLPDSGKAKHSLTGIHNLLHAIKCALQYETAEKPEAFNITDASPIMIADAVQEALGRKIRIGGIPTKLLLGATGRILGVSEYEIRQLGMDRTYDLTKARQILGYHPTRFQMT